MTENEARELIRDYFNEIYKEKEILNKFDLVKCECGNYELEEDMVYHKWDIAQREEQICKGCRNDQ